MSTPNPVLVAAAPSLIACIQAVQGFGVNIGPDPTKWALLIPGAIKVMLGEIEMQLPAVVTAEVGEVQSLINTKTSGWIASLQALAKPAA